jgi:hypothetical protein
MTPSNKESAMTCADAHLVEQLRSIDDRLLLAVVGGGEAEHGESDGVLARTTRWIEQHDLINYGVGIATGLAIVPIVAHAAEKSWKVGKWGVGMAARMRRP